MKIKRSQPAAAPAQSGTTANTTGTQGKTCVPTTADNPYQPAEAPLPRHF